MDEFMIVVDEWFEVVEWDAKGEEKGESGVGGGGGGGGKEGEETAGAISAKDESAVGFGFGGEGGEKGKGAWPGEIAKEILDGCEVCRWAWGGDAVSGVEG